MGSVVKMTNYYDIDDILAEEEVNSCLFVPQISKSHLLYLNLCSECVAVSNQLVSVVFQKGANGVGIDPSAEAYSVSHQT